jgi:hypothetical protein
MPARAPLPWAMRGMPRPWSIMTGAFLLAAETIWSWNTGIRQLGRLAMFALVCCFVALAVRTNLFALIVGAETAVALLWAIWLAK